jgi:hypothetical protein
VLRPRQQGKAGKGRQRLGARHATRTQFCNHRDRYRYRQEFVSRGGAMTASKKRKPGALEPTTQHPGKLATSMRPSAPTSSKDCRNSPSVNRTSGAASVGGLVIPPSRVRPDRTRDRAGHIPRHLLRRPAGDAANIILSAVGYNLRLVLALLMMILRVVLLALLHIFAIQPTLKPAS